MSPLSLYYTTADIIDDFIRDTMHLFGRVIVKSTVAKKKLWMLGFYQCQNLR